jgi:hypothetical protein
VTPAVSVPPVRRNLRSVLVPMGFWVLLRGGRLICAAGQRCVRAVPTALPLSAADTHACLTHEVR